MSVGSCPVVMSCRVHVGIFYEARRRGPKKVAWFMVNGSRDRDCLIPIGDEDFGFRRNAVEGEHVEQAVTGEGWNTRAADQVDWDEGRRGRQ